VSSFVEARVGLYVALASTLAILAGSIALGREMLSVGRIVEPVGYESPEEVAFDGIPERYVALLGVRIDGDRACVWSLTNDRDPFEPYEDYLERRGSRWFFIYGNGGFSLGTPPEIIERAKKLGYRWDH
jgi:hypothetical protein